MMRLILVIALGLLVNANAAGVKSYCQKECKRSYFNNVDKYHACEIFCRMGPVFKSNGSNCKEVSTNAEGYRICKKARRIYNRY